MFVTLKKSTETISVFQLLKEIVKAIDKKIRRKYQGTEFTVDKNLATYYDSCTPDAQISLKDKLIEHMKNKLEEYRGKEGNYDD